jgi:hypothetical protein
VGRRAGPSSAGACVGSAELGRGGAADRREPAAGRRGAGAGRPRRRDRGGGWLRRRAPGRVATRADQRARRSRERAGPARGVRARGAGAGRRRVGVRGHAARGAAAGQAAGQRGQGGGRGGEVGGDDGEAERAADAGTDHAGAGAGGPGRVGLADAGGSVRGAAAGEGRPAAGGREGGAGGAGGASRRRDDPRGARGEAVADERGLAGPPDLLPREPGVHGDGGGSAARAVHQPRSRGGADARGLRTRDGGGPRRIGAGDRRGGAAQAARGAGRAGAEAGDPGAEQPVVDDPREHRALDGARPGARVGGQLRGDQLPHAGQPRQAEDRGPAGPPGRGPDAARRAGDDGVGRRGGRGPALGSGEGRGVRRLADDARPGRGGRGSAEPRVPVRRQLRERGLPADAERQPAAGRRGLHDGGFNQRDGGWDLDLGARELVDRSAALQLSVRRAVLLGDQEGAADPAAARRGLPEQHGRVLELVRHARRGGDVSARRGAFRTARASRRRATRSATGARRRGSPSTSSTRGAARDPVSQRRAGGDQGGLEGGDLQGDRGAGDQQPRRATCGSPPTRRRRRARWRASRSA